MILSKVFGRIALQAFARAIEKRGLTHMEVAGPMSGCPLQSNLTCFRG